MINEPTTTNTTDLAPVKKTAKKKRTLATPDELLVQGAKAHYQAAAAALRKGCAHALITGLHLAALHLRTSAGHGGVRFAGQADGFKAAVEKIGMTERTAYRWMTGTTNALVLAGTVADKEDFLASLPEIGTALWGEWETALARRADGMSLNRLVVGSYRDRTEEHRLEVIISSVEQGEKDAEDILEAVAEGDLTLAQAVKALGSLRAYKARRAAGEEKIRKDPVYLDFDPISKQPVGLLPKAMGTLHNGFQKWDDYDPDARESLRALWLTLIKGTPRELAELLRK